MENLNNDVFTVRINGEHLPRHYIGQILSKKIATIDILSRGEHISKASDVALDLEKHGFKIVEVNLYKVKKVKDVSEMQILVSRL